MALFLVQHGKSLPKDKDPEQALSKEGISEVEQIAKVAKGYGIHVSRIIHSGKKRARQTADIFASSLGPEDGVQESSGLKPLDDVSAYAGKINSEDNVMLVGHLPFMERLTSYLITGSTDRPVFKFQNGGIVCMDTDLDSRFWFIRWALMPKIG
ncbi:MAG: phosphohistidine phosphatase SixA [Thermodesulfobacteriota bacterium]|nr:phosphohistidine phosphatase SixA [Thermodesulfobacteriota bacterium]